MDERQLTAEELFTMQEPGYVMTLIKEMGNVKAKCHEVFSYSFTCFPLVYTQVSPTSASPLSGAHSR